MKEREISMMKHGYKRFLKAAYMKESNTAKIEMELNCVRAIQGHCGGIPVEPELMDHVLIFHKCKKYMELPVHVRKWIDSGRQGER